MRQINIMPADWTLEILTVLGLAILGFVAVVTLDRLARPAAMYAVIARDYSNNVQLSTFNTQRSDDE